MFVLPLLNTALLVLKGFINVDSFVDCVAIYGGLTKTCDDRAAFVVCLTVMEKRHPDQWTLGNPKFATSNLGKTLQNLPVLRGKRCTNIEFDLLIGLLQDLMEDLGNTLTDGLSTTLHNQPPALSNADKAKQVCINFLKKNIVDTLSLSCNIIKEYIDCIIQKLELDRHHILVHKVSRTECTLRQQMINLQLNCTIDLKDAINRLLTTTILIGVETTAPPGGTQQTITSAKINEGDKEANVADTKTTASTSKAELTTSITDSKQITKPTSISTTETKPTTLSTTVSTTKIIPTTTSTTETKPTTASFTTSTTVSTTERKPTTSSTLKGELTTNVASTNETTIASAVTPILFPDCFWSSNPDCREDGDYFICFPDCQKGIYVRCSQGTYSVSPFHLLNDIEDIWVWYCRHLPRKGHNQLDFLYDCWADSMVISLEEVTVFRDSGIVRTLNTDHHHHLSPGGWCLTRLQDAAREARLTARVNWTTRPKQRGTERKVYTLENAKRF